MAALISLLTGIALFGIQQFSDRAKVNTSIAEAFQYATGLSLAENDLRFFPRMNKLEQTQSLIRRNDGSDQVDPQLDHWGFIDINFPNQSIILNAWKSNYMGTTSRPRQAITMFLPDVDTDQDGTPDGARVSWPSDPFGNPYLLYQFKSRTEVGGAITPLFLEGPFEDPDFLNAIVSYGKNRTPGGNEQTQRTGGGTFRWDVLVAGALYVEGDTGGGNADFTLRVADPNDLLGNVNLRLVNSPPGIPTGLHLAVLQSLSVLQSLPGSYDPSLGLVGVIDPGDATGNGSDDIVLKF